MTIREEFPKPIQALKPETSTIKLATRRHWLCHIAKIILTMFGDKTTVRSGKYWSTDDSFTETFTNGRRTGTQYDAAGNITSDSVAYTYDAAGRNTSIAGGVSYSVTTNFFDGDGAPIKREYLYRNTYPTTFYLRSSVLGGKTIAEIEDYHNGQPIENSVTGSIYAGAEKIASQYISHYNGTRYEFTQFTHDDLLTGTKVISFGYGAAGPIAEFDPNGVNPGFSDPANIPQGYIEPDIPSFFYIGSSYPQYRCQLDGSPAICHDVERLLRLNLATVVPGDTLIPVIYQGKQTFARYQATGDGYQGYVPVTARYTGDGFFAPINFSAPTLKQPGDPTDTDFHTLNGSTDEALLGRYYVAAANGKKTSSQPSTTINTTTSSTSKINILWLPGQDGDDKIEQCANKWLDNSNYYVVVAHGTPEWI